MSYAGKNPITYKLDGYVATPALSSAGEAIIVFDDGSGEILKSTNGSAYSPFGGLVIGDTISGTVQTIGLSTDVVASYNLADDTAVTILILVTGRENTGGTQAGGYLLLGVFRRSGVTVTQLGSTAVIAQSEDDAGWNATMVINSTTIEIQVTGNTGDTIDWRAAGFANTN